eukprot:3784362-Alexandrium_andersonii.AAC.1
MPCFGQVGSLDGPLNAAISAFIFAVAVRYAGWHRICAHHRKVSHWIKMANLHANTEILKLQGASRGRAARVP